MTPTDIRAARKSLGLTQAQMVPLLGYASQSALSNAETGKSDPNGAVVRLLRAYLDGYRPDDWPKEK